MSYLHKPIAEFFKDIQDRFRFKFYLSTYCLCDLEQTNSMLTSLLFWTTLSRSSCGAMTLIWEQIIYKKFNLWLTLNMRQSTSHIHYSLFTVHLIAPKLYHNECTCLRNVYEERVSLWQSCQVYQKQLKNNKTVN